MTDRWEQMVTLAQTHITEMQRKVREDIGFGPTITGMRPDGTVIAAVIVGESTADVRGTIMRTVADHGCDIVLIAAIANVRADTPGRPILHEALMAYVEAKSGARVQFFCKVHEGRTGFGPVERVTHAQWLSPIWERPTH
jgi:hypothetical protein